jgi:drug/metabolite transporter (DMT)-like permease
MLLLGSVGTGFAYIWNYRNVTLAGSTIASTVTYVTPVVAAILGVLLLNEKVHLIQYIGGAFILFSAALVQQKIKLIRVNND